jgi:glycosyltransferase involved in cell wall biosynthesis
MITRPGIPLFFVVPDAIDDPARVSGGNIYDQRVRAGLRKSGWDVRVVLVPDGSGDPGARTFSDLPDGALVLVDGLIAVHNSEALAAQSSRLRIVLLAHMVASVVGEAIPPGTQDRTIADRERQALSAATRIIATSEWTRAELISRDLARPGSVVVAQPGTEPAEATVASRSGGRMLCVGVVAPHKGQDLMVAALANLTEIDGWSCSLVGSLDVAPTFVDELMRTIRSSRLTTRTSLVGVLTGRELDREFGRADLIVVPSRIESFGMVVAEAGARGIPVVATRVGGITEATSDSAAAILVPADDPWALEVVLRQWLVSPERRGDLKTAALEARGTARTWSTTLAIIESLLDEVSLTVSAVSV